MAMSDTTRPGEGQEHGDGNPFDGGENEGAAAPAGDPHAIPAEHETYEEPAPAREELELGDDDTRLPWLEGPDDEPEYEGYNTAQLVAFVLVGLLALGVLVGGVWWLSNRGEDSEVVADGSVIRAPEGEYKERPEDPGGMIAQGTGDTSYAVSEGERRPVRLGEGERAEEPGFETVAKANEKAAPKASESSPAPAASPSPAQASGVGVQVAAYTSREQAETGWNTLVGQYSQLSGMKHRIVEGQADIGKVFRVQAVPGDAAAAKALCRDLKAAGLNCQVKN